jgi:HEAT repeat protein
MKYLVALAVGLLIAEPCSAGEVAYRDGGKQFAKAWHAFYDLSDHEPEIDDPLINRGRPMVPSICNAIAHKDMKYRRYAIGALGYIGDERALSTLEAILRDSSEIDYFRGDALHSIYLIDRKLGTQYARQYQNENEYLTRLSAAILKQEPWLLEPTEE